MKEQKALLYNPLSLTDGIEASDDPILPARPAAYAISYTQRGLTARQAPCQMRRPREARPAPGLHPREP